jgi:hypothetical protein
MVDYGAVLQHPFEKEENPQRYNQTPFAYVSPNPARVILGLYGGNEVSLPSGNMVDVESDLFGITRPNTWSPQRQHQPPVGPRLLQGQVIERKNPKNHVVIKVEPKHLPTIQPWAYPAVSAPLPLQRESCAQPHKY